VEGESHYAQSINLSDSYCGVSFWEVPW